ncbi:uncharacterized protein LOC129773080 [Toxorhynchites rutilus septentrionalis]|uniref:uncharacterized protein LOC129773080 n=1 Tax=Toxorhynchites rutilus septentrionalis TaxID=329112 RepID=UPI00247A5A61|nr:uncharacterized protein LOC129773080 [Toxorhynchites rutilus septentrionalis]
MEDTQQLRSSLNSRRRVLLSSLERSRNFMDQFIEERDMLEVAVRLENLNRIWQGLEEVQSKIEEMEETEEEMGLKLPTISLPEFAGDYKDWLAFHDTFLALIHTNPEVAEIQKFHYLRAAVKGEAAQLIESISISAANYPLAWEALVKRYANEYLLKKRHLQALFDGSRMKKESASILHDTVDNFERHVRILGQLGEPTDSWSAILEHLLCTRLHDETLKAWEDHASTLEKPTYQCLIDFLQRRMRVLESISVNNQHSPKVSASYDPLPKSSTHTRVFSNAAVDEVPMKCYACDQRHPLVKCYKFARMSTVDKLKLVNSKRICINCFRTNHFARQCTSNFSCRICKKRHHTLLHPAFTEDSNDQIPSTSKSVPRSYAQTNVTTSDENAILSATAATNNSAEVRSFPPHASSRNIFMLTVVLVIVDRYGKEHLARALLDSASQPNILSERMAQILRLKRKKVNVMIHGVGDKPQQARDSVSTQIRSRKENFELDVDFLILEKVTSSLPTKNVSITNWNIPKNLFLADPTFHKCSAIDMIIGNEHFFSCFKTATKIQLSKSLPLLVESVFGWIVSGSADIPGSADEIPPSTTAVSLVSLEQSMERFWEIEELPKKSIYSKKENECEIQYSATVSRNHCGRYIVRLPRHSDFDDKIGESKSAAIRRLKYLEKRLYQNPELKHEYCKFMYEYVSLGHMRPISNENSSKNCYLPHHPAIKDSSTTTKTRVVFDGSAKTSSGYSLNEALLVGPIVQDDLLSIILRFRTFPIGIVADIEKMYRQVRVHYADTPFQRILWRFEESDPIQTFELQTVTYGLTPSSFLATRTLIQLADDEGANYPLADKAIRKGFYVDDFIGGAQSIEEATQLRSELDELLAKGGFNPRKWTSNILDVLNGLSEDQIGIQSSVRFDKDETVKTLGICWEPESDIFRCDAHNQHNVGIHTKRSILSEISRLYDPLGFISPIVIRGKIIMQLLWLECSGWDEEVPNQIAAAWEKYAEQLPKLAEFQINRYAFLPNSSIQLHTFADASEAAYGACTYARSIDPKGRISVQLLASKSRVAPLKRVSLPRLELCAASLAAKLHRKIVEALQIKISSSCFWSDSTVTLQWIKSPPNNWKTFVANRVSDIQSATHGSTWKHVPGKQNPADMVSRGMNIEDFLASHTWTHGPEWLSKPEAFWPSTQISEYPDDGKERRRVITVAARHYHLKLIHGGGRHTLSVIRERYWPINGRRLIRSVIRNCFRCARASPVPANQQIGQLPVSRTTPSRPFTVTGVDYAGPVYLKPVHRKAAATKAYICIFICFSTKAVHIELASDLSTQAFLAVLRRFIARRGRPRELFSDNGKNFVGAHNELMELYIMLTTQRENNNIQSFCANEGIIWHFSPPRAPHFGGLWEAAVKVAKKHLHRQLLNARLSFEDLSTILTQIEASMNSRPLVPLSEDPNDLACLTPGHFLIGSSMQSLPEIDVRNIQLNKLDHYQALQRTYQQFWHHWSTEYLQELQRCTTHNRPNHEFHPGRLVVLVDEMQHPVKWSLARILDIHPGKDKFIRVLTLKTCNGIIKRPITKICLLPHEDSSNPS